MSHVTVRFSSIVLLGILLVATTLRTPAAEISVSGISFPLFDSTGKLTHKVVAKRGVRTGAFQNLYDVEIQFFSPKDPAVVVQKLEAIEATWDARKETLVGRGSVMVATEENRLTGEGFDFALATSLLHIHRNFAMSNREFALTSDRAKVELVVEREKEEIKVRDVKRCEAIGNLQIVVQPTATKKYEFEKARSDLAIYDGATQTITLPNPIQIFKNGEPGTMSKARINLKNSPAKP